MRLLLSTLCLAFILGVEAVTELRNGEPQRTELMASSFAQFSLSLPSNGALPLQLSLTRISGEAGLFVFTEPSLDATNKMWELPTDGGDSLTIKGIPKLLRSNVECKSTDVMFGPAGAFADATACADACAGRIDCRYFIFGKGAKAGACYMEATADGGCSQEGFEEDEFDFYQLGTGGPLWINVQASSDATVALTASWAHGVVWLGNGVPQAGMVETGSAQDFVTHVSGSTSDLSLSLVNQYGEADIYVKTGSQPSATDYTWAAATAGDDRLTILHSDPHFCTECDYYVRVVGRTAAAFMLTASSGDTLTLLQSGIPADEVVGLGKYLHFKLLLPSHLADVQVVMTRLSGNPDVYVSLTTPKPTAATASRTSYDLEGDVIRIKHDDPKLVACVSSSSCALYLTVYGQQDNSAFSLRADALEVGSGFHVDYPDAIAGDFPFEPATFGSPLPIVPLTAPVVYASPGAACPPDGAPDTWKLSNAVELAGAIAVVDRGESPAGCPYPGRYFANKVAAAQAAGASAVIMVDNQAGMPLVSMGAVSGDHASGVTIPSMFVSYDSGAKLKAQLSNGLRATLSQPRGSLPLLISGRPTAGVSDANEIQYYELWTGPAAALLTITVSARFGDPDLFVSATGQRPNAASYTWKAVTPGSDSLSISSADPKYRANSRLIVGVLGADSSASYTITYASRSDSIALQSNVPLPAQEVDESSYRYYRAWVDSSADAITVAITVMQGDADLYVSFDDEHPTADSADFEAKGRADCATVDCGNTIENGDAVYISRDHPKFCQRSPCMAYIGVFGAKRSAFTALVTTADAGEASQVVLLDGQPTTTTIRNAGEYAYYNIQVPQEAIAVTFAIQASTGDPDLYVGFGNDKPTRSKYSYRSTGGSGEMVTVTTSDSKACVNCMYRVAVYAWKAQTSFAITATMAIVGDRQGGGDATSSIAPTALQNNVSAPFQVEPGQLKVFRYTLYKSSPPCEITFSAKDGSADARLVYSSTVENFPDIFSADKLGEDWHSFSDSVVISPDTERDSMIFIAVESQSADDPVIGSLFLSDEKSKGGGMSGAAIFSIILFVLVLVVACAYGFLVMKGKRDPAVDFAYTRANAASALSKMRSTGTTEKGPRARVATNDHMVAPLRTYEPPVNLPPLADDGTQQSSGRFDMDV